MRREEMTKLKFEFYKLRGIDGKSFDQISIELDVSKPTLIKWEKESRGTLDEIRASEIQNLLAQHCYDLRVRLANIIELSKKVNEELQGRDFSTCPVNKLIELQINLNAQIEKIENGNKLQANNYLVLDDDQYFTES